MVHPELKTIYVNDFETEEPELILPQLGIEAQMLVRDDTFCTTTDEAKFGRRALQVNTPDGTGGIYWVEALGDRP